MLGPVRVSVYGCVVTAADCRAEAAELLEQITLDLQASAARRRNNGMPVTFIEFPLSDDLYEDLFRL